MEKIIGVLAKQDFTAEEITDILWLALLQWQSTTTVPDKESAATASVSAKDSPGVTYLETDTSNSPPPVVPPPSIKPPTTVPLYSRSTESSSQSSSQKSLPFSVPNAAAIRNSRSLLRSLRPLMQRVPSQTLWRFDENATVQFIAETRLWLPQREPLQEPWLELALVVDASPSMLIWQRHVLELQGLLAQTGAFRDVRTWSLDVNSNGKLCLYPKLGVRSDRQQPHSPQELIDPTKRRLILVVSDCISHQWESGTVTTALKVWAENGIMALLQMLPEWMWDRTALFQVPKVRLHSQAPGMVNQKLSVVRRDRWRKTTARDIRVPVLTLEVPVMSLWSQMVSGKGNLGSPGLLFSPIEQTSSVTDVDLPSDTAEQINLSSEERVQRFRIFSSPMARRLAGLLAACPVVSLPIVRMVQDAMVPLSEQMHVAEVLLSGLFRLATPIEAHTNPDDIEYKFSDEEIRRILLDSTPVTDTFKILSKWIAKRLGKSLDEFIAILQAPESNSATQEALPFAEVAIEVLKRQGSKYANFVTGLEQRLLLFQSIPEDVLSKLPPIRTFEFEVATISIEDEDETDTSSDINLQPFEFEVATIELKKSGWLRRKTELIVKRSRKQAWGFIEDLGNGVQLEMVAIPEGSFLMGSPEDELERRSNESPQHKVTIQPFFFGKYPVTQAQWRAVASLPQVNRELKPDPSHFKGDNRPVEQVSWYDCMEFCDRLSKHTNKTYRLPNEAEWEYACRAGTTTPFHFGETITSDLANYNASYVYGSGVKGTYRKETTPVGSFGVANAFGLYDLHGQVWEWCQDHWHDNYEGAPTAGEAWINQLQNNDNQMRRQRGGSWLNNPVFCRSACRDYNNPEVVNDNIGFRVVCVVLPRTQ